jgi:NDP-sugar pyrophosphorylase family protein
MILAAGRGTRLANLRLGVPKALVEVGGRPLLQSQIEYLAGEGIKRIIVNAYWRAAAIEAFVREHWASAAVTVTRERKLLGTAGAVRNVLTLLGPGPFFVLYGDVLIRQSLIPITAAHRARAPAATVTVYESDEVEGKGTVLVDDQGWVTMFREKQTAVRSPALINAGLYLLEPSFLADLPPNTERDFGRDVFPAALGRGARVLAYRLEAPAIDVGTPEGLALAQAWAREAR